MTKATVKWFNLDKGFGFVTPDDGSADAFLHISAVERAGIANLSEGTILDCELGHGEKGPQVEEIFSAEAAAVVAPTPGQSTEGTVKWFNSVKGFGFVQPDDGSKDIFVHISALERSGIQDLAEGQRVRLSTTVGQKGPQAEAVEVI